MILIENPIDFFNLLDWIPNAIDQMVQEEMEENESDLSAVCFRTGNVVTDGPYAGTPIVKSFFLTKQHCNETTEDTENKILQYYSLCYFSLNNEDYYEIDENQELNAYIHDFAKRSEFVVYVCDLTHTYYCKITDDSKKYFAMKIMDYWLGSMFIESENILDPKEQVLFHYHYNPYFIYEFKNDNGSLIVPFNEITDMALLNFYGDSIDDIECECITLTNRDFFDEENDNHHVSPNFYDKSINTLKNNYANRISTLEQTDFQLFEKTIPIVISDEEKDKMNTLASVIEVISDLFCHPITHLGKSLEKEIDKAYKILVDKTISEGIGFESVSQNTFEMMEIYSVNLNPSIFTEAFHDNPNTYLIHKLWKHMNSFTDFHIELAVFDYTNPENLEEQIKFLPLLKYINDYCIAMQEAVQKASEYTEKVNNFNPEFIGGGVGLKGAAKGILMASIANAVTETAYTVYQSYKFGKNNYSAMLNEFMQTDQSKQFIKELIKLDFESLYLHLLKAFCYVYNRTQKKFDIKNEPYENIKYFDELYDSFEKSYKLYTIALAKYLNLTIIPQYDEMSNEYELTEKQLLEKAILEFPYDRKYYEKYLEVGGEITEELKLYADLHMVNIDDLYEKEKERLTREKAEREEQERKQEEDRKRKEDEIRQATEKMNQKYGDDLVSAYSDLFSTLPENPLFLEYCDTSFEDHLAITNVVFTYLEKHHKNDSTNFYPVTSPTFQAKQRNLISVYGSDKINPDSVLFFYDNTVFGSAKDGFVLTRDNFCNRNTFSTPSIIPIEHIRKISIHDTGISINDSIKVDITLCKLPLQETVNILAFCICNLLALSKRFTSANTASTQCSIQADNKNEWKCTCGNLNSNHAKFCSQCGSQKVEANQEWICTRCKTKNSAIAKFCIECGNSRNL